MVENASGAPADKSWKTVTAPYQRSVLNASIGQLITTFVPYVALWCLMAWTIRFSYPLTFALAVLASGFLVRVFIIFHDCGHGSFFKSKRWNNLVGFVCGVLTFTPYQQWTHSHAMHHATSGDLDRRGHGDIETLTVQEFLKLSPFQQFRYRVFRNPIVMLTVGPVYTFIIGHRLVPAGTGPREQRSIHLTNLAILLITVALSFAMGFWNYLLIQLPVAILAGAAAIWLFYCQHQFEDTYWARHEEWDYEEAAMQGSSYFKLPRVLQFFTGNIGFHHIHHLSPRIPNYNLEAVHNAHPRFQEATTITLRSSVSYFALKLWDEERKEMVGMKELRQRQLQLAK
ncbi:MAG: fatty acid desaturase [Roseiflexaceae bacterium]|nr:fatty acid desaturase [Roseiflexaceae bacterium]